MDELTEGPTVGSHLEARRKITNQLLASPRYFSQFGRVVGFVFSTEPDAHATNPLVAASLYRATTQNRGFRLTELLELHLSGLQLAEHVLGRLGR